MNTPNPIRPLLRFVTAGLLAAGLLAGCAGGATKSGDIKAGAAEGDAVKIEAGDNFFKPESVTLQAGETVTFEIDNIGDRPHDWTVDDLELSTGTMSAGEIANATFVVPDNDLVFVCTLHRGMEGTIKVN